jgi:hypothetical protein
MKRERINLRMSLDLLRRIDQDVNLRLGHVSRNQWIIETIERELSEVSRNYIIIPKMRQERSFLRRLFKWGK